MQWNSYSIFLINLFGAKNYRFQKNFIIQMSGANVKPTWKSLGEYQDNPDIQRTFTTDSEAKTAVTTSGFGRKGTSHKWIVKKKVIIGSSRFYACDNAIAWKQLE